MLLFNHDIKYSKTEVVVNIILKYLQNTNLFKILYEIVL